MAKHFKKSDIDEIVDLLKKGKVIAFPTDTVFGLGCLYDDLESLNKIMDIKHRDKGKSLPIMCSDIDMAKKVALISDKDQYLMNELGPGAITYIFKKQDDLDNKVTAGKNSVAIRIPDDRFILDMISKVKKPMLVTSCNYSNEPSLKKHEDVVDIFDNDVDIIVCEDANSEIASTIFSTIDNKILREGIISIETIEKILNDY